jgi:ribokinase
VSKVLVVGSTNTDLTVRVPRLPAPGETALGRDFRITAGGKGANQAVAAARAGASVVFVTALGTDDFGQRALENLVREGIDVSLVRRVPETPSGVALIVVDDHGENSIAVAAGANGELRPDDVEPLAQMVNPGDVLLLQLEIPLATVEAAADVTVQRGGMVILNPAPARALPDSLLALTSIITPNQLEAEQLTGETDVEPNVLPRASASFQRRGVRDVIITMGAKGVYISENGWGARERGYRVEAVDTTAAGDVFNGALAASLVERQSLTDAVRFANAAAALSVTKPGAQSSAPLRSEIEAFLRERS